MISKIVNFNENSYIEQLEAPPPKHIKYLLYKFVKDISSDSDITISYP